jgi:hypothetical protein
MRRILVAVLAAGLLAVWGSMAFAISGSAVATATLRVKRRAVARIMWEDSGQVSQDFGTVASGATITDNLILEVDHNLGFAQTFSLSAEVTQPAGPDWQADVGSAMPEKVLAWLEPGSFRSRHFPIQ